MKLLKRLYMKTHGFIRIENRWLKMAAWIRKGHEGSVLPTNMILEDLLFELSWKEIVKRYGK